jgi:hypothetical protein
MSRDIVSFSVVVTLSLAACGGSSTPPSMRGNVLLADKNNYSTTASLTVPTVETVTGMDIDVCWSAVSDDLQCHPVTGADLNNLSLLRISHLTQQQVQDALADGQLSMAQVAGYLEKHIDSSTTCAKLSDLSFFGTAIDVPSEYVESDSFSYLLLVSKGTVPGIGARTMTFLKPTASSTNTHVDISKGCGMLDFSADLASLTPLAISKAGPWMLDWRDITRDGMGNPVPFEKIDGVTIGFYAGKTVADLQAHIFDIEMIATTLWDIKLTGGKTADLSTATDRASGAAFTGFDSTDTGTWMLALTCSRCQTPAPVVLTILAPGGA